MGHHKKLASFMIAVCFIVGFTKRLEVGNLGDLLAFKTTSNSSAELRPGSPASKQSLAEVRLHRVASTNILAFSAYLDVRDEGHDLVRVFALAPRTLVNERPAVTCAMTYPQGPPPPPSSPPPPPVTGVSAEVTVLRNHYNFEYAVVNFLCRVPKGAVPPSRVALTVEEGHGGEDEDTSSSSSSSSSSSLPMPVQNREVSDPPQHRFGVCLPALFGEFGNALLFVQSAESYRLLGAGFLTVYNSSVSPELDAVLRHYARTGFADIVQWPITDFLKPSRGWDINVDPGDIHYYGQIATVNDCMYRNMYRARYLAIHDVDEIIVPRKWSNWSQMMEALDEPAMSAYYFRMHNFPVVEIATRTSRSGLRVRGTDILGHVAKVTYPPGETATKVMVRPRGVQFHDVHQVLSLRPGYEVKRVADHEATVQHYKWWRKSWDYPSSSELIRDTNLLKYSREIEDRVKLVLDRI